MRLQDDELTREFNEMLEPLHQVPQRNLQKASAARSAFLAKVEVLSMEIPSAVPVSETPFRRLNGWISVIINPLRRKERVQMFSILTALVVAVTIVFGGAGATAYAAEGSLPEQALYPVKVFTEDMRVNLAADPQGQVNLLLDFADRRVQEMAALQTKGEQVPPEVQERYRWQMENAFQIAAGLGPENMLKTMALIQQRVRNQERIVNMLQPDGSGVGERVQAMIREQVRVVENGLVDPNKFQYQYGYLYQHQVGISETITDTLPVTETFGAQGPYQWQNHYWFSGTITGTVPITDTPGMQYGPAGPEYGPGPNAGPEASPGPGYGPGPGTGSDSGTDPNPEPGSDGGNEAGPGDPDHDRDAMNSGDNENAGGSDNGGSTDSGGSADSGGDSGGGGGDSGGNGGGSGGGGGGN